jgi:hypothetical protein
MFHELAYMHLVVTEYNGNDTDAVRIYTEKYARAPKSSHFLLQVVSPLHSDCARVG